MKSKKMSIENRIVLANSVRDLIKNKGAAVSVFLLVVGLTYYGQYYDHGFNYGDEGKILLIAERILQGSRPYLDIEMGYGLLWYYPLVALFKVTGVSLAVARVYFLGLALMTSLLAFLTVRAWTRDGRLAAVVALAALAVPGTLHKTYVPLIVVANMACLPRFSQRSLSSKRIFGAGLVAALSYHVRPEMGLLATLVLLAALIVHAISRPSNWFQRVRQLLRLPLLLGVAALAPTLPLALMAYGQGFLESFVQILYQPLIHWDQMITLAFKGSYLKLATPEPAPGIVSASSFLTMQWYAALQPEAGGAFSVFLWGAPAFDVSAQAGKTLARVPLAALWGGGQGRDFAAVTYLPLFTFAAILTFAIYLAFRRKLQGRSMVGDDTIGLLAVLGLSLCAFPQFFFFRPDVAHWSQFVPGYLVLVGVCLGRWVFPQPGSRWVVPKPMPGYPIRAALGGLLIFQIGLGLWFGLRQPGTGSIAQARGCTERFVGANGIDIMVRPGEAALFATVTRLVEKYTDEDDPLLCFPYAPGFNVMTNRETFARKLYVDDLMLFLDPGWQQRMVDQIAMKQVPLIIIQDWAINNTEISRFHNWASVIMAHIEAEYVLIESLGGFSFYLRRSPADDALRDV